MARIQDVKIVTDVCNIYTTANTSKTPWAPAVLVEDSTKFIQLRKDDRGIPRAIGLYMKDSTRKAGTWGGFIDAISNARDKTLDQMIDKFYENKDRERPSSYVTAYCGANIPKVVCVAVPEIALPYSTIPALQFKMRASSRKHTLPEVELREEVVAWFLSGAKAWHDGPPTPDMQEDTQEVENDGIAYEEDEIPEDEREEGAKSGTSFDANNITPVKWRRKRNQDYLMIEWIDSKGEKHSQWELPKRESQIKEMVIALKSAFFEELSNGGSSVQEGEHAVKDKSIVKRQRTMTEMFGAK